MLRQINEISPCNINILLFGNKELNLENNKRIFSAVQQYLAGTKRFE